MRFNSYLKIRIKGVKRVKFGLVIWYSDPMVGIKVCEMEDSDEEMWPVKGWRVNSGRRFMARTPGPDPVQGADLPRVKRHRLATL